MALAVEQADDTITLGGTSFDLPRNRTGIPAAKMQCEVTALHSISQNFIYDLKYNRV